MKIRKLNIMDIQQGNLAWYEKSESEESAERRTEQEREVRLPGLRRGQKGSPMKGY